MRQAFHILRKDVCRLWIEILISAVALSLLTWTEWQLCTPARNPRWYNSVIPVVAVFLSWWFLVVRLIHGDALVGDRQFWVTRPYIWYKLLAAKTLFVLACVGTPLLISQMILLLLDRAPVSADLGGAILGTGGAMLAGILPVAAFAAITRNLSRWLMCSVVLILFLIGMVWLDSVTPNSHVPTGADVSDYLQAVAFGCLTILGITIRYARRHSLWGMVAIGAGIVAVPVIMVVTPYRAIIASRFPIVDTLQVPFRVMFVPKEGPFTRGAGVNDDRRTSLDIPIEISGMGEELLPRPDGVMLSIDLPDGRRWDSEWQPAYQPLPQDGKTFFLRIEIDHIVYERVKAEPTPVRLSVAFTQLADRHRHRIIADRAFELAGVGPCWLSRFGSVECRSTASGPLLVMATVFDDERTCPADSIRLGGMAKVSRSLDSNSTSGPLSPLILRSFAVGQVCPGTPVQFSAPEVVRRFRVEIPLGLLRLNEYAATRYGF